MNTIILLIISIILLIYIGVILYAFFNTTKLAGQFIDKKISKRRWKFACFIKSSFWAFIALLLVAVAFTIETDTAFFSTTKFGSIVGVGIILNLLASLIWLVYSKIGNTIRKNQADSLEKALMKDPRGWKFSYFNRRKAIILEEEKKYKEKFIDSLTEEDEPIPIIKK